MKALLGAVLIAAFVTPAFAADEFYVVQDNSTKKCMIVDKKPESTVTTTTVVGGNGKVYTTRTEAESAMKTEKNCTTLSTIWSRRVEARGSRLGLLISRLPL